MNVKRTCLIVFLALFLILSTSSVYALDNSTDLSSQIQENSTLNGVNDSEAIAETKEINREKEEYLDFIIIAKETEEENIHERFEDKFDIVVADNKVHYDGGLVNSIDEDSMAAIRGTIWNDDDQNGVMNEKVGIKDVTVILEQFDWDGVTFVDGKEFKETTTDGEGNYEFTELLPYVFDENTGNRIPVAYKVKLKELPDSSWIVTKMDASGERVSKLDKETLYIGDFIILAAEATHNNPYYEFTFEGKTYDILLAVDSENNDGGLYQEHPVEDNHTTDAILPEIIVDIRKIVQTGDETPIILTGLTFIFAIIGSILLRLKKKRKKKDEDDSNKDN